MLPTPNRHATPHKTPPYNPCTVCGQSFSRYYNMVRHKERKHPEALKQMDFKTLGLLKRSEHDKTETSSRISNEDDSDDDISETSSVHDDEPVHDDDNSVDHDNPSQQEESEDDDDEDKNDEEEYEPYHNTNWKTTDEDNNKGYKRDTFGGYRKIKDTSKGDESDPFWDLLRDRVINSEETIEKFEKHVEKNKENEDWSERRIMRRAWKKTLPTVHRQLEYDLESFWILHELANKDKTFQKMVATKRKLVTSENFEPEEAIRYTIKKDGI